MASRVLFAIVTAAVFVLGGCSAGAHAPVPDVAGVETVSDAADALTGQLQTGSELAQKAIHATNVLGSTMRNLGEVMLEAPETNNAAGATGRCADGTEFLAPDAKGDPDSTELRVFYDAHCSQLAVDQVRLYTPTGSQSESVDATASIFEQGKGTPVAVIDRKSQLSNATFDRYGFPIASKGFVRVSTSQLSVAKVKEVASDSELIVPTGNPYRFCQDAAGYSLTGIPSLDATFGWEGGVLSGGTVFVGGDSFRLSATIGGTAVQGALDSLALVAGTPSSSCPIATPAYTLSGGASIGTITIPVRIAFHGRVLSDLTIDRASILGTYTLNVVTRREQGNEVEVLGALTQGRTRIATLHLDAFGDGTLTVTSTGAQYKIVDWVVVGV
jgi:hypothetical protein